jgi:protein-S-isoprenylcysteine O-methyltransferase Ste14
MTRLIIWIILIFGGSLLGYYVDFQMFQNIRTNYIFHAISTLLGVFILFITVRISKNTGRTLAKYGRKGNIKRMETNVLVKEGVYGYMRHPMHLGLFLFPLGFAFLIGSPSFILIIAPVEVIFMRIMIHLVEEPEAINKFGEAYLNYKKEVPGFCFKKICLKELFKDIPKNHDKK